MIILLWIARFTAILAVLVAIYIVVSWYKRRERRLELEAIYDAEGGPEGGRRTFIADGLADYDQSLEKKLLFGIVGLPFVLLFALIILAHHI